MAKILVIRFSSIGDLVLTSGIFSFLEKEGHQAHAVVKPAFVGLMKHIPGVQAVHVWKGHRTIDELKKEEFDFVLDLQANRRSALIRWRLGRPFGLVDKRNVAKWLWVNWGKKPTNLEHIVVRYSRALEHVLHAFPLQPLSWKIQDEDAVDVGQDPYVAVAIGATFDGKKPDANHWGEYLRSLPYRIVLLGGKEDEELALAISKLLSVDNQVNRCTLGQSAYWLAHSRVVISGDTGLMHIAAALKKPIVSLWGCTHPDLGMSPWMPGEGSVMIQPEGHAHRPCSKLGDRCKQGMEDRCIHHLSSSAIAQAVDRLFIQTAP